MTVDPDPDAADAVEPYNAYLSNMEMVKTQHHTRAARISIPRVTGRQLADHADSIERWREEARQLSAGRYGPGTTRGKRFEDGYIAARLDAQGMLPGFAHPHADLHLAVARTLTTNQARAKREGVAAGYAMHGQGPRSLHLMPDTEQ